MLRSMNSFPSTSHTCEPLPRCRYFGATPPTYWPGPLASVCVAAGISAAPRAYHSFERVMTGSTRSSVATSGMDITSRMMRGSERSGTIAIPRLPSVTGVDGGDVRPRLEQREDVREREERPRGGPEGVVDRGEKLVVLEVIDRPPMRRGVVEPRLPRDVVNAKTFGAFPDERCRVLALVWLSRLDP